MGYKEEVGVKNLKKMGDVIYGWTHIVVLHMQVSGTTNKYNNFN